MKSILHKLPGLYLMLAIFLSACNPPKPGNSGGLTVKKNFIILLDLSDRIIVQDNQPERDKELIRYIYGMFENDVRDNLYIRSRDEIRVVIAPQHGADLPTDDFENRLYINMDKINIMNRRSREDQRRKEFMANLDTLYQKAVFSKNPEDYNGADIWKYFNEDLRYDYVRDTLTKNYLFILTDGYPIVGNNPDKLEPVKMKFPGLHVILLEASPREKDLEWDHIMSLWKDWFTEINIPRYTIIKKQAISKEEEMINQVTGIKEGSKFGTDQELTSDNQ